MRRTSNSSSRAVWDCDSTIRSNIVLQGSRKARLELRHLVSTERSSFTERLDEAFEACRKVLFDGRVQHSIGQKGDHDVSEIS